MAKIPTCGTSSPTKHSWFFHARTMSEIDICCELIIILTICKNKTAGVGNAWLLTLSLEARPDFTGHGRYLNMFCSTRGRDMRLLLRRPNHNCKSMHLASPWTKLDGLAKPRLASYGVSEILSPCLGR